jgi:hypothetical protein
LKQQLRSVFGKGDKAQFIQHNEIKFGNRFHELGEAQVIFCGKQIIHQTCHAKEANPFPLSARG